MRKRTSIPPEQRLDAIKFKEEMQAKLEEKLAGLSPEDRTRKIRELAETGPLGEWWKSLPRAKTPSTVQDT